MKNGLILVKHTTTPCGDYFTNWLYMLAARLGSFVKWRIRKITYRLLAAFLVSLCTTEIGFAQLANTPWPMLGHDARHSSQSQYKGIDKPRLKWKFKTGSAITSDPVIGYNGMVFIADQQYFYAIDQDGGLRWKIKLKSLYHSTPAINIDSTIYIRASTDTLYAVNPDGTLKWKLGGLNTYGDSSPNIGSDGTIYVGASNSVCAVNPDGTLKWKKGVTEAYSSPALGIDGTIYYKSGWYDLFAFNIDGSLKWQYDTDSRNSYSPAVGSDGTILVDGDTRLRALHPNGNMKWFYYFYYFPSESHLAFSPSIGSFNTVFVYYPGRSESSDLYAISNNGSLEWKIPVYGYKSPAIDANGILYCSSYRDTLYAVNPNGTFRWKYKTGGGGTGSPSIDYDGTIYYGCSDGFLYALGPNSDSIPPSSITDLSVQTVSPRSIILSWTSTGDDSTRGYAFRYDLRYSNNAINESNWEVSTKISNLPDPLPAGNNQVFRVNDLVPNNAYYFAIRTADEMENWSGISNVVLVTTVDTMQLANWQVQTIDGAISFNLASLAIGNNIPCIAYQDNAKLYYSSYQDNKWSEEIVASEKDISSLSSAVFSQNSRCILYHTGKDLKSAIFNGTSWQINTILSNNGADCSSLAVDVSGKYAFCYYDNTGQKLKYGYYDGTSWQFQTIDSYGRNPALCFDTNKKPHVSYYSSGRMKHSYYDGSTWNTSVVDSGRVNIYSSITVNKSGLPHIVYSTYTETCDWSDMGICIITGPNINQLKYAYFNGANWSIENIESTTGSNASIFMDQMDKPYIVFYRGERVCTNNVPFLGCMGTSVYMRSTQYAVKQGSTWSKSMLFSSYCPYVYAMDRNGNIHYCSIQNGSVIYSMRQGSTWQSIQTVVAQKKFGKSNSIVLNKYDQSRVSYYNESDGDLKWAYFDGTNWRTQTVDSIGNVGTYTSIVLDQNGAAHIGYRDEGKGDLKYARFNGSSWSVETVDTLGSVGQYTSIALNQNDQPIISYYDATKEDLKCAQFNGSFWQVATVDSSGAVGLYSSLVVNSNGNRCIAYYDQTNLRLKYTEYTGSAWSIAVVDSGSNSLGGISLASDQAGNPGIGYVSNNLVKYAHRLGSSWQIQLVDNQTASDVSIKYSGNKPYIAYNTTLGLMLAIFNGSHWRIYDLGIKTEKFSLALDKSGNPHISYYDSQSGSLKYIVNPMLTGVESQPDQRLAVPSAFSLLQNYPNPFNPSTTIRYQLPRESNVTLRIYNLVGQLVATLVEKKQQGGYYQVQWSANVASGVYFYQLQAGQFIETKKMTLLR